MTAEVIVSYLTCKGCGSKGYHVEDNRGQGVISFERWKVLSQCGCKKIREKKAAWPREAKVQQGSVQSGELESAAKEEEKERDIRRMFKILREV